jgi:hypothetical protein
MGHATFIVLHLVAVLFAGAMLLFLTIPLHVLYGAFTNRAPSAADAELQTFCPDCGERVLRVARKCKHCGSGLTPS